MNRIVKGFSRARGYIKRHPISTRVMCVLLALIVAVSAIVPLIVLRSHPTIADPLITGEAGDGLVTWKEGEKVDAENIEWDNKWFQSYYDDAYSNYNQVGRPRNPIGDYPNGSAYYFNNQLKNQPMTPDHVQFYPADHSINFYGYCSPPYFDALYTEQYDFSSLDFNFTPKFWDPHCFKLTGLIINGHRDSNNRITGYLLTIGDTSHSLAEGSTGSTYYYDLYYVENLDIDGYNQKIRELLYNSPSTGQTYLRPVNAPGLPEFNIAPGATTYLVSTSLSTLTSQYIDSVYCFPRTPTSGTTVARLLHLTPNLVGTGYSNLKDIAAKFHLRLDMSNDEIKFRVVMNYESTALPAARAALGAGLTEKEYLNWILNDPAAASYRQTVFTQDISVGSGGRGAPGAGFGIFTQYTNHICCQTTQVEYQELYGVPRVPPNPPNVKVKFQNYNTNMPLDSDLDIEMELGTGYWSVDPAQKLSIDFEGKRYSYFKADREELTDMEVSDNPQENIVTLYYIEEPTLEKHARLMNNDGAGTFVAEGVDKDGLPLDPQKFEFCQRLQYTITLNNPNLTALNGPAMQITDVLPAGLKYVSSSVPLQTSPPELDGAGRQILVWDVYDINPNGVPENNGTVDGKVSVAVEVSVDPSGYGKTFVNGASLYAPDTGLDITSNLVYHEALPLRLHLRQIVLGSTDYTNLPLMGYLQFINGTQTLPATCFSGLDGSSVDFSTYTFLLGDDLEYFIRLIVPQNYRYEGYLINEDGNHDSAARILPPPAAGGVPNGEIPLDYSKHGELWLTLYIEPDKVPKDYTNSYASNFFGQINKEEEPPPGPEFPTGNPLYFIEQGVNYVNNSPTQTQLYFIQNVGGGAGELITIGDPVSVRYNSMGFHEPTMQLYALKVDKNELIRIGRDGTVTELGSVSGLPVKQYNAADFGEGEYKDILFVRVGLNTAPDINYMWLANVATMSATRLTLSSSIPNTADIFFMQGYVWAMDGEQGTNPRIFRINPANGQVNTYSLASLGITKQAYGAQWKYSNEDFGLSGNKVGEIYRIHIDNATSANPTFSIVSKITGPTTTQNDGASYIGLVP